MNAHHAQARENRAATTGPVHHKTVLPATDNATPTIGEAIALLAAELDREPSPRRRHRRGARSVREGTGLAGSGAGG